MGKRHVKRGERKKVDGDMNNLYGWNMSGHSPTGEFHETEFTKGHEKNLLKTIFRTPGIIIYGWLLEFDLEYPSNIHKKQNIFHV